MIAALEWEKERASGKKRPKKIPQTPPKRPIRSTKAAVEGERTSGQTLMEFLGQ